MFRKLGLALGIENRTSRHNSTPKWIEKLVGRVWNHSHTSNYVIKNSKELCQRKVQVLQVLYIYKKSSLQPGAISQKMWHLNWNQAASWNKGTLGSMCKGLQEERKLHGQGTRRRPMCREHGGWGWVVPNEASEVDPGQSIWSLVGVLQILCISKVRWEATGEFQVGELCFHV